MPIRLFFAAAESPVALAAGIQDSPLLREEKIQKGHEGVSGPLDGGGDLERHMGLC